MSSTLVEKPRKQNDCGCCQGIAAQTPAQVYNRPGLKAIAYRAGNYEQFRETMLARISASQLLSLGLRTRNSDDFSIALLDTWAEVADVLTFYQERIANESYLRTATERRSVLELARTIGYELSPGVAANVYLAFEIDNAPGSPPIVNIEKGIKVQSTPGPGEQPQIFETVESIESRADWNAMRPKMFDIQQPNEGDSQIYLNGTSNNLKKGDMLLLIWQKKWALCKASTVELDFDKNLTFLKLDFVIAQHDHEIDPTLLGISLTAEVPKVFAMRLQAPIFGFNAMKWNELPRTWRFGEFVWNSDTNEVEFKEGPYNNEAYWVDKKALTNSPIIYLDSVYNQIVANSWVVLKNNEDYNLELCLVADASEAIRADYGISAKATQITIYDSINGKFTARNTIVYAQSEELTLAKKPLEDPIQGSDVTLDRAVVGLKPKQKVILSGKRMRAKISKVTDPKNHPLKLVSVDDPNRMEELKQGDELILLERPMDSEGHPEVKKWHLLSKNGLNGFVEANWKIDSISLKLDTALAVAILDAVKAPTPEPLSKAEAFLVEVISDAIKASTPKLLSLKPDQLEIIGSVITPSYNEIELVPSAKEDDLVSEFALIQDVSEPDRRLVLSQPGIKSTDYVLKNIYDRSTVKVSANVALATHGETASEILGSGDAGLPSQRFVLSKSPLTYVSATTPRGSETTLEVRVNDILWKEVPSLYGCSSQDRVYVTRLDDEGKTTVQFGDGHIGARLLTGQQNIRALYRKGIGLGGLTKAGQINMLMTRPLGVKGVVNPLPSSGAQDKENLADARKNAPLTVLTLDRIVSLQDYEDFARSFAGIAKALATWTWNGERTGVLVTVAGPKGQIIPENSVTYDNLISAMRKAGDPYVSIALKSIRLGTFSIKASVKILPEYIPERVLSAIEQKLRANFSFEAREFGQSVFLSDIIAVIHNVIGVTAVNIRAFYMTGISTEQTSSLNKNFVNKFIKKVSTRPYPTFMKAAMPQPGDKILYGAMLLVLDPAPLDLVVMS